MTASVLNLKVLVAQMKTVIAAIAEYDRHLEALCQTHDDYHLFAALPGAGPVHAARLTAALGSDRSRWQTADELVRFSGIAPVIERSGKQFRIRWRYFCPKFFRQTFHEFAAQSIQDSFWARAYYCGNAPKAKSTTPPFALWLSNGFGSSGSAGRLVHLTTRSSIWRVCGSRDRRCSSSPPTINSEICYSRKLLSS